ncbi:hypothetical protein BCR42DRAFT_419232 [Absidia repens]|uniref:Uncharacterized protein n=1 Tax=Absidia repens TaxID=90262 RepID=A0A1X2IB09_9FUNG|nr:hypothetical protein BCR42DRAFT_419232 [Absidia repens]
MPNSNGNALFGHSEKVQTPTSTATTLHHLRIPEACNNNPALHFPQQRHHQQHDYRQCPVSMFPGSGSALTTLQQPQLYHYFPTTTPHHAESSLSSPVSPTFVPIETSPLTLVPRAAIWKDPQRRRGVNELDLWEQKQQQQRRPTMVTDQHVDHAPTPSTYSTHEKIQSDFIPFPPFYQQDTITSQVDDDGDDDSGTTTADASLDNDQDRPWQRYVQSSSRPVDLSALNEEDDDDQHSLHSSSTILHPSPIYNLNQEADVSTMETDKNEDATKKKSINSNNGLLESSGSSQWLCPPSTFNP